VMSLTHHHSIMFVGSTSLVKWSHERIVEAVIFAPEQRRIAEQGMDLGRDQ